MSPFFYNFENDPLNSYVRKKSKAPNINYEIIINQIELTNPENKQNYFVQTILLDCPSVIQVNWINNLSFLVWCNSLKVKIKNEKQQAYWDVKLFQSGWNERVWKICCLAFFQ